MENGIRHQRGDGGELLGGRAGCEHALAVFAEGFLRFPRLRPELAWRINDFRPAAAFGRGPRSTRA